MGRGEAERGERGFGAAFASLDEPKGDELLQSAFVGVWGPAVPLEGFLRGEGRPVLLAGDERSAALAAVRDLQVELEVLNTGEADLLQLAGAAAVVLEVHLLERFGGDLLELLVAGALLLGVEEAGGVLRR